MSLSDRFKRLPEEQALRFQESQSQARDASALLTRLRTTREEAERLALDEINRTKTLQREEVDQHPEIQDLKRRLRSAEASRDAWMQKSKAQQENKAAEVKRLRAQEDQLLRRFNDAKDSELRQQADFDREQRARHDDEARLRNLQIELDNLKREEDFQFVQQVNSAQVALNEAERDLAHFKTTHPESEVLRAENKQIEAQMIKEQEELEQIRAAQFELESKREVAQADLSKAESLFEESRDQERSCKDELERKKAEEGTDEASKIIRDAEQVRTQLLEVKRQFDDQVKTQHNRLASAEPRLTAIRNEMRRLMEEEGQQLKIINEAYSELKQAQMNCSRVQDDLKTAEIRVKDAQQLARQAEDRRAHKAEQIRELQVQYDRLNRAHHDAGTEVAHARDIISTMEKELRNGDILIAEKQRKLSDLSVISSELSDKLTKAYRYDKLKAAVSEKRDNLAVIQSNWYQWKSERIQPLLKEMNELEAKQRFPLKPAPVSKQTDSLWREIESIRERIMNIEKEPSSPPVNFESPEALQAQLQQKEVEIRARLMSRTSPASPRFSHQLEREAEAIMRAEAAASLERKQEAIEREASALSSMRIEKNPQLALDEEAKARLWSLNEESAETGTIAQTVLDLVHSKNISLREA